MADTTPKLFTVRTSSDNMQAYLTIDRPPEGVNISFDDAMSALRERGVTTGIDEDVVREMVSSEMYRFERLVANGTQPENGTDGYYIYHFEKKLEKKPTVLDDGSVDYWNCNAIALVEAGDVIAEYIPAEQGTNGVNVRGAQVFCKRSKDLLPLKGRGFTRSTDGLTYVADITGKIEENGDRIVISNVYEIRGDVDIAIGNVDFSGDVIIHGAVRDGISIKATGTVTIDGIVEGAKIESGGDIILKSGLLGNSKGSVYTKGNLIAKFIEFATVKAEGNIQAETFMESDITSNAIILLDGGKSKIIGGYTSAAEGIEVRSIGNAVGVRTVVKVGFDKELRDRMEELRDLIEKEEANIERIENGIKIIEKQQSAPVVQMDDLGSKKMQLLRVKIKETSDITAYKLELEHLEELQVRAKNARIKVGDTIYPGTRIMIDDYVSDVKAKDVNITYMGNDEDCCIRAFRAF